MTIAQIKERLSIVTVLTHYGLQPNANNMLQCPWHEDKKPSMKVYVETNTVYCFAGGCELGSLDVIDFIMKKENISKHKAIEKAKELCDHTTPAAKEHQANESSVIGQEDFEKFMMDLKRSRKAQDYLNSRCLSGMGIGYKKGGGTWARGCVLFPLRNQKGEIVSLYGRSITGSSHYYQANRSGLYPGYPEAKTEILILCESIIDAITLDEIVLPLENYNLLALYGTNGLTAEHRTAILELKNLKEITFALDGDEAGIRATGVYAEMLRKLLPKVKFTTLELPKDEDINSLAVSHGDHEALFTELFNNRTEIPGSPKRSEHQNGQIRQTEIPTRPILNTNNPFNLIYKTSLAIYYIKGGIRHTPKDFESLKITLVIANEQGLKSRNKVDLYEDKQVEKVSRTAGEKLDLRPDLLELDIQILTDEVESYREKIHLQQIKPQEKKISVPQALKGDCMTLLKTSNLIKALNELIGRSGIVGEEDNRMLLFAVGVSYKMPETLHALILGSSGSGKTRLMKIIADLMPPEDVKRYTRVTDNSFYNQGEYFFVHKLICFEDMDGLKEEAEYAVRELQSNDILRTSTSVKDASGNFSGGERVVRGPIASLGCTTKGQTYDDNVSRCFLIAVDERPEQTQRVIDYQNKVAAGLIKKQDQQKVKTFLQNCVRLLQSYEVVNPYADKIKLPPEADRIRRLNELYQSFVKQITLLHQYQRKQDKAGNLISEKEDLQAACDILFESIILKVDELDGSLRQFFEKLKRYVKSKGENYEFNRFEIRKVTGVGKTQQHNYISRLVEMEYLKQYGFANRGYRYKIAYWDDMKALRARIKKYLDDQLSAL